MVGGTSALLGRTSRGSNIALFILLGKILHRIRLHLKKKLYLELFICEIFLFTYLFRINKDFSFDDAFASKFAVTVRAFDPR